MDLDIQEQIEKLYFEIAERFEKLGELNGQVTKDDATDALLIMGIHRHSNPSDHSNCLSYHGFTGTYEGITGGLMSFAHETFPEGRRMILEAASTFMNKRGPGAAGLHSN